MFVHPSWFSGILFYAVFILIPVIFGIVTISGYFLDNDSLFVIGFLVFIITALLAVPAASVAWHYCYEVSSIQEKNITVENWQPSPGVEIQDGMMVINSADDLMLVTTDGEGFYNNENLLFGKFDTRDILTQLRPGGTYTIKYYGWREGFNSGFPNILEVTEVVNESGTSPNDLNNYLGNRLISTGGQPLSG